MVQVARLQYVNTLIDTPTLVLDHILVVTTLKSKVGRLTLKQPLTTQVTYKLKRKKTQAIVMFLYWYMHHFHALQYLVVRNQRTYYKKLIYKIWDMVRNISWNRVNLVQWWTSLHSLIKGALGELAVQKDLIRQGYNIYAPIVDVDQVDLIVELNNGSMKRLQIKTVMTLKRGTSIEVNLTKYKNTNRIDVVAVYFLPKDIIAYYPYDNKHQLSLALTTGKNNQTKGRKWFYSYERFPEFS
jgi:hypothetical protein